MYCKGQDTDIPSYPIPFKTLLYSWISGRCSRGKGITGIRTTIGTNVSSTLLGYSSKMPTHFSFQSECGSLFVIFLHGN